MLETLSRVDLKNKEYRSNSVSEFLQMIQEEKELYKDYRGNTRMFICKSLESQLKKILQTLKDIRNNPRVTDRESKMLLLKGVTLYSFFHEIIAEIEKMKKYMHEHADNFDYKQVPQEFGISPASRIDDQSIQTLSPDSISILEDFL